jgi:hypothetical protein
MSYDQVEAAMSAGTPHELICAACPWDRLCIQPPAMTSAEIDAKVKAAAAQDEAKGTHGTPATMLITAMVYAGRDTSAQVCPVFAVKLRSPEGRQIADGVRASMRGADGSVPV